jgi:uroporphyrinogen-III synthase
MRTVDLGADDRLRGVTDEVIAAPPEWVVATTGMGMRAWFAAADEWGLRGPLLAALARSTIVARGAKASSAIRQAGLDVAWRAPGESMAEVVEWIAAATGIGGGRLALQLFDPDEHPATAQLRALVGSLVEVPLYRWLLPEDTAPAEALIDSAIEGDLGAVTFTSQPAVRFLFRIAERSGRADGLRHVLNDGTVLPACIGPVCAEAAFEVGIAEPVWPEPFRLPPMVRLVAERLNGRA